MGEAVLSVVMSVYNGEKYLKEAIDSVINQTYKNWEMIVVNDASTDKTAEILEEYSKQDKRIKVLTNDKNKRLPASLNYGISHAKGKYIVRMDADDICSRDRFEKQLRYMERHPQIELSWGLGFTYYNGEIQNGVISYSVENNNMKALLMWFCPIYHNGVIMRRELFETFSYQPEVTISEDWRLWSQIICQKKIQGMRNYSVLYRIHDAQATSEKNREIQKIQVSETLDKMFKNAGFQIDEKMLAYHISLIFDKERVDEKQFLTWASWLVKQNKQCGWCRTTNMYYGLMWKTDELYRNGRITGSTYCKLCAKISICGWFSYLVKKIAIAFVDMSYRVMSKTQFTI